MENTENMIEFISGERYTTVTLTNRTHITKLKKIYEKRSGEFKYFITNPDGSICAKFPLRWIRINAGQDPSTKKEKKTLSEEERKALAERLKKARESKSK